VIGRQVVKVGRSSGLTTGKVTAYAVEYNDEKGVCFFTDLLVVGENNKTFDMEGDSGSLILFTGKDKSQKPRPVGLIWGGTANRGRLKLNNDHGPENWTSGVDVSRLLDVLQLDLVTNDEMLQGMKLYSFSMSSSISVCLSVCLSVYLSVCMSVCMSVCISVCLYAFLKVGSLALLKKFNFYLLCGFGFSEDILAQHVGMAIPIPMQMPTRQMVLLPACGRHMRELSPEAGELEQGGPGAKKPMVLSMLKGKH
jgi:hypothetical protein